MTASPQTTSEKSPLLTPSFSPCHVDKSKAEATPLPILLMTVLLVCLLADALSITVVYPLAPYLVQHFFKFSGAEQSQIGYYAGVLAAAYSIGQIIGSPVWGSLSDRFGRRTIILICMTLNVVCLIAFGLSSSYQMALVARLAQGFASGDVSVIKTYIADITDSTNECRAFAMIAVTFGVGISFGPSLGGLLADPADRFPSLFSQDSLFGEFPYLLPVLVIAVKIGIDFFVAIFYLPESAAHLDESENEAASKIVIGTPRGIVRGLEASVGTPSTKVRNSNNRKTGLRVIWECKNFRYACGIQALVGLCCFAFWEILPVWSAAPSAMGGVDFRPSDIGSVQSFGGICILISATFIFPRLCQAIGFVKMYRVGIFLLLVSMPAPAIVSSFGWEKNNLGTWILLNAAMMVYAVGNNSVYTSSTIMFKQSVPKEYSGLGIGIAQSVTSIGYAMGPILGGAMFSYFLSIPDLPAPFNLCRAYFFVLEILLLVAVRLWYYFDPLPWTLPSSDGEFEDLA